MNFIRSKIESILISQGSKYFKDFQKDKFKLAISKGDFTLKNLELKENAISLEDQPFCINSGHLEEINIKIPWSNLFNDACEINISGVDIEVGLNSLENVNITQEREFENLKNRFKNFLKKELKSKRGSQQSSILDFWMIKGLIERILDNLQISIRKVRFKLKESIKNPFELGIELRALEIFTTDSGFAKHTFVTRQNMNSKDRNIYKVAKISGFNIYLARNKRETLGNKNPYLTSKTDPSSILKFSVNARIRVKTRPEPNEPQYSGDVRISQTEISISQWQVLRLLVLSQQLAKFNERVEIMRQMYHFKPSIRIKEIDQYNRDADEKYLRYEKEKRKRERKKDHPKGKTKEELPPDLKLPAKPIKKSKIVTRWWKFAILSVMRECALSRINQKKEKLLGVFNKDEMERINAFRLPSVVADLYSKELFEVMDDLIESDFDFEKVQSEWSTRVLDLRTLLFSLTEHEQKVIIKKWTEEYVRSEKERKQRTWKGWALSWVPDMSNKNDGFDSKNFQKAVKSEIKLSGEDKQLNKYILEAKLVIVQGEVSLRGGSPGKRIEFVNTFQNLQLNFRMFEGTMSLRLLFEKISFLIKKQLGDKMASFEIFKSNCTAGERFLDLSYATSWSKNSSSFDLDLSVANLDLIFVKELITDLTGFFVIPEELKLEDKAYAQYNKFKTRGGMKVQETISSKKKITPKINVLIRSPRVLVPLAENIEDITGDTNVFVLNLGDLQFNKTLNPKHLTKPGAVYDVDLKGVNLTFWEDMKDAIVFLDFGSGEANIDREQIDKIVPNFVFFDFSAVISYRVGLNSTKHVSFKSQEIKCSINAYLFQNLLQVKQMMTPLEVKVIFNFLAYKRRT